MQKVFFLSILLVSRENDLKSDNFSSRRVIEFHQNRELLFTRRSHVTSTKYSFIVPWSRTSLFFSKHIKCERQSSAARLSIKVSNLFIRLSKTNRWWKLSQFENLLRKHLGSRKQKAVGNLINRSLSN